MLTVRRSTFLVGFSFSVTLIAFLTFTVLNFGQICYSKNIMFIVLSFSQVTNVLVFFIWSSYKANFVHLFSVMLTSPHCV